MTGTAVADATDALIDLWTAANIAGLQIVDGAPYDVQGSFLAVGWTRDGQPGTTGLFSQFTAALSREREQFDVNCLLSLWLGDQSMRVVRRNIVTTLQQLESVVAANRTLNGAVMLARFTNYGVTTDVGETGGFVDHRFTVHCDAVK